MVIEEKIIHYDNFSEVDEIISKMTLNEFLLVEHKSSKKQLFFKKVPYFPETLIIGER
jgi:hypothetical protein